MPHGKIKRPLPSGIRVGGDDGGCGNTGGHWDSGPPAPPSMTTIGSSFSDRSALLPLNHVPTLSSSTPRSKFIHSPLVIEPRLPRQSVPAAPGRLPRAHVNLPICARIRNQKLVGYRMISPELQGDDAEPSWFAIYILPRATLLLQLRVLPSFLCIHQCVVTVVNQVTSQPRARLKHRHADASCLQNQLGPLICLGRKPSGNRRAKRAHLGTQSEPTKATV